LTESYDTLKELKNGIETFKKKAAENYELIREFFIKIPKTDKAIQVLEGH
jgi:hypothetical protein